MITIAIAAAGAGWEASAMDEIAGNPELVLIRRCVDAADLLALAGTGLAQVAIVEISASGLDVEAVAELENGGVQVFGWARGDDGLGIDRIVQAGTIADSVAKPVNAEIIDLAPHEAVNGSLVAVWGPTGAPGRTTLAVATAAAMAQRGVSTVLVDADTYGGAVAQTLALLDDVSGIMAACRLANLGERGRLLEHVLSVEPNFDVLTGLPRADMWRHLKRTSLDLVMERLRECYQLVIVDCGFGIEQASVMGPPRDQVTRQVLETADAAIVVGRADPVGLTRLIRGIDEADSLLNDPIVVINFVRESLGWAEEDMRSMLSDVSGIEPSVFLSQDSKLLDAAVVSGQPANLLAPQSPFAQAIERLTVVLAELIFESVPMRKLSGGKFSTILTRR